MAALASYRSPKVVLFFVRPDCARTVLATCVAVMGDVMSVYDPVISFMAWWKVRPRIFVWKSIAFPASSTPHSTNVSVRLGTSEITRNYFTFSWLYGQ